MNYRSTQQIYADVLSIAKNTDKCFFDRDAKEEDTKRFNDEFEDIKAKLERVF